MIKKAYIREKDQYCIYIIDDNVLIVFYEIDGDLLEHRITHSEINDFKLEWQAWTINHTKRLITRTNPPRTTHIWSYETTNEFLRKTVPKFLNDITPQTYHPIPMEPLLSEELASQIFIELRRRGSVHEIEKPEEERLTELESSLQEYVRSVKIS